MPSELVFIVEEIAEGERLYDFEAEVYMRYRTTDGETVSPQSEWVVQNVVVVPEPGVSAQLLVVMMAAAIARRWKGKT